jgi:DNA (cytosine-5)-methyltransferase 1
MVSGILHEAIMKERTLTAADLFCGAGGASNGLRRACLKRGVGLDLVAVNHWPLAIETHKANHPEALHYCEPVENINPRQAVPGGRLDLLLAGPECTHHSIARGGKPINDQSRASAWCILRWATALEIESILIENVREFREWGPLGRNGRPLKSRKGETFEAFLAALRSLNYRVEWRILNAANYGDPTTRERLFIQARKGRKPITWPAETHTPDGGMTLFGPTERWRPAREIIDWSIHGTSIWSRKRPLRPNTLARIAAGIERFWGDMAKPFLVMLNGGGRKGPGGVRTLDEPLPVVTAGGNHFGLCEPFLLQQQSGGAPRRVSDPVPTIATAGAISLVQPFVMSMEHSKAFVIPTNHGKDSRTYPIDRPMPTITTVDAWGLVSPFITKYYGTGKARPVTEPLDTVTTRDRFGLVVPQCGAHLDILFRMLQPHELAAAMGFDPNYRFCGSRENRVKQIGNAWPNGLAEALCSEMLEALAA